MFCFQDTCERRLYHWNPENAYMGPQSQFLADKNLLAMLSLCGCLTSDKISGKSIRLIQQKLCYKRCRINIYTVYFLAKMGLNKWVSEHIPTFIQNTNRDTLKVQFLHVLIFARWCTKVSTKFLRKSNCKLHTVLKNNFPT